MISFSFGGLPNKITDDQIETCLQDKQVRIFIAAEAQLAIPENQQLAVYNLVHARTFLQTTIGNSLVPGI